MLTAKKFPWVSLLLLLVSYTVLGWLLYTIPYEHWAIWLVAGVVALLISGALTSALPIVKDIVGFTLKSDSRAFIIVTIAAFLTVLVVTWFNAFAHVLILMSAESLARLELQTARFNQWQAFSILSLVSLVGLGIGGLAHSLVHNRPF
ncbi:MAG: hypothetical protein JOZ78_03680 [Chroococcidiopsidaceae cyanobacterium CP_BM_ER_R8_30]|nr:hypothetical protein [Chroococcidiopsidaceae cyanobacterium CP_BM_ER_R8_30]